MDEILEVSLNKKEMIGVLEDYYKKLYNDEKVNVCLDSKIDFVGIYEQREAITDVILKKTISIGSLNTISSTKLSEEELKEIFNSLIDEKYSVDSIEIDSYISNGDYFSDDKAVCKGINLKLKKKVKQKIK